MADDWVLTLHYSAGKVVDATAGPAITAELEEQMRTAIDRDLRGPTKHAVWRSVLFSSRPVDGWWRYRTDFQIVPVPADAPRPKFLLADHPFIVDFEFLDSANWQIRNLRTARKAYELELLLDLFLRTPITSHTSRGRHHWIITQDGDAFDVRFVSEGYFIAGFEHLLEHLPDVGECLPLAALDAETYYHPRHGYADTLTVPAELAPLFDAFGSLMEDERERFLRAC